MNSTSQSPGETAMQKEQRLFSELFDRLINAILNRIFDLRPASAQRRMRYLFIMFLLACFLIILQYYPLLLWAQHIQDIFIYLLNPVYAASYVGNPFTKFMYFVIQAVTDPRTFQYFPIFLAPFFIALHAAALYLADIFELEDVAVARSFVWEVALSGSDETIRITQGAIAEKHLESPNYLIGGPGKVVVDLDSVALFEKADGTPHVIGPTGKEPGGRATLDGFERFRQAIDIRDHYIELRDQDPKSQSVKGRSRDGIPITATDVRLMFSINRGENAKPSSEFPYPFGPDAIEKIVYKSASKVTPDQTNPSAYEFSWINNMIGLIRGKLGGFMSERNLTEYLANIGLPELEKLKVREEMIVEQVKRLTQPTDDSATPKAPKPPPNFTPRHQITNLFSQFTDEFTKSARDKGVELQWIGVGTWKTPPEMDIISEKQHLEAWKLSQDNMKNGSQGAFSGAENHAILQKMEALIRSVPFDAYLEITGTKKQFGKKQPSKKQDHGQKRRETDDLIFGEADLLELLSENVMITDLTKRFNDKISAAAEQKLRDAEKDSDHRDGMRTLLLEYRNQLLEAVQFMKAKDEAVPPIIEEAIKYINNQMGFTHWAGR
jgi:hypothetical protein